MPTECLVHGCKKSSVSKGLCDTHRKRKERHGHVEQTRSGDWGAREKHPAYTAWCNLRRAHSKQLSPEWATDFWAFVRDTPERPGKSQAQRERPDEPWGPGNFYWKEPRTSVQYREDRATYMREWQRQARAANRDYGRSKDLKKNYGVDLEWYNAQLAKQNGLCAICDQEETAVIRGQRISLAVDHCHDTGTIRGLLCRACNNAIGGLRHDTGLLQRAIEYLQKE